MPGAGGKGGGRVKYSDCCGTEDRAVSMDGPDYSDIGICPDCGDHCEFEEDDEYPQPDSQFGVGA